MMSSLAVAVAVASAPFERAVASSSGWQARATGDCNIKGTRNRKGQWIYHLLGDRSPLVANL